MSGIYTPLRWGLLAVTLLGGSVLMVKPAAAQAPAEQNDDYLDQVRRRNEVIAQKLEADVRLGLREATRLAQTNPARAVEKLKQLLAEVEGDNALPQGRREVLVRVLKDRIRVTEAPPDPPAKDDAGAAGAAALEGRRRIEDQRAQEQDKMKRSLESVHELRIEGQADQAQRKANELTQRYPDNPTIQGTARTLSTADQVARARAFEKERERRLASAYRDIDQSSLPGHGDIEFPKDWRAKTERRKTETVTAKERAILQALNSSISVRFKESRFEDVIEYISTVMGQPIILDENALKEADITYETPVSAQVKGVAVRTLLRKVLGEFNLTYVIKDQAIEVTSVEKAKEMMIVRSYPVGDLVSNLGPLGGVVGLQLGPGVNQLQMMENVKALQDMIQNSIEPGSWQGAGGQGAITFNPGTMSLVIKQSAEVHSMIGSALLPK
ncbi:MAG: hypothetical protein JO112_01390 [Planctomycetes bacterium]|nr:hypothetical protein [Planctomycetota bacterium]